MRMMGYDYIATSDEPIITVYEYESGKVIGVICLVEVEEGDKIDMEVKGAKRR